MAMRRDWHTRCTRKFAENILRAAMNKLAEYPADHEQWLLRLGVAAGIGFLIGLDREFTKQRETEDGQEHHSVGLRTCTLISVLGYVAAMLAEEWGRIT